MNPRTYVKEELWREAPVLTGTTKFEPLHNAKNILITGGAGFMYVLYITSMRGVADISSAYCTSLY